jgi:prepilin-type N-terminal cleavage/methylation domain-containing protein
MIPRAARRAFTLVEVLATLLLISIILPVAMKAVSVSTQTAAMARRRTEAGGLAEAKLAELVATAEWQGGVLSGDFGSDWPDYRWSADVTTWTSPVTSTATSSSTTTDPGNTVNEIDLHVSWRDVAGERAVTLSTLVYQSNAANSSTSSSSTGTGTSGTGTGGTATKK